MERTYRDPKRYKWLFKPLILLYNYLQMTNEFLCIYKTTGETLTIYKINNKYYTINSKNKTKEYKKEDLIFIW
jgi:hypothetical protein